MRSCEEGGEKVKGRGLKRRGEESRVPGNLDLQLELFVGSRPQLILKGIVKFLASHRRL